MRVQKNPTCPGIPATFPFCVALECVDVAARRKAWSDAKPDLDPQRPVLTDETGKPMHLVATWEAFAISCESFLSSSHVPSAVPPLVLILWIVGAGELALPANPRHRLRTLNAPTAAYLGIVNMLQGYCRDLDLTISVPTRSPAGFILPSRSVQIHWQRWDKSLVRAP